MVGGVTARAAVVVLAATAAASLAKTRVETHLLRARLVLHLVRLTQSRSGRGVLAALEHPALRSAGHNRYSEALPQQAAVRAGQIRLEVAVDLVVVALVHQASSATVGAAPRMKVARAATATTETCLLLLAVAAALAASVEMQRRMGARRETVALVFLRLLQGQALHEQAAVVVDVQRLPPERQALGEGMGREMALTVRQGA